MAKKSGFISLLSIIILLSACVAIESRPVVGFKLPNRASCEKEAHQLDEAIDVYGKTEGDLEPITKLEKGRFVYKCEKWGKWLGIMFPGVSDKIDCSERPIGSLCRLGWIPINTKMLTFG